VGGYIKTRARVPGVRAGRKRDGTVRRFSPLGLHAA